MLSSLGARPNSAQPLRQHERAAESYERQIRIAESRGDEERARALYEEYERFLVAWRAQEELESLFPASSSPPTPHSVGAVQRRRIAQLLRELGPFSDDLGAGGIARASALYVLGRQKLALEVIDGLLGFTADEFVGQRLRGLCQQQLGAWQESYQTFSRVLKLNSTDPTSLAGKGMALQHLGRHEEALVQYGRALEFAPQIAETHYRVGECLMELGRGGVACLAFDRAVSLSPHCKVYREKRARTLLSEGRLRAALEAYEGQPSPAPGPSAAGDASVAHKPVPHSRPLPRDPRDISRQRRRSRKRNRLALLALALATGLFCGWAANSYVGHRNWSKRVDIDQAQRRNRDSNSGPVLRTPQNAPRDTSRGFR